MGLENNESAEWFPPQDKGDEELPPDEKLDELKSPTELEIRPEQIEEPDIADEPVRIYLHEIGRVHLLTAADEKVLTKKMEEGKRIKEIKQDYLQRLGRFPYGTGANMARTISVPDSPPETFPAGFLLPTLPPPVPLPLFFEGLNLEPPLGLQNFASVIVNKLLFWLAPHIVFSKLLIDHTTKIDSLHTLHPFSLYQQN